MNFSLPVFFVVMSPAHVRMCGPQMECTLSDADRMAFEAWMTVCVGGLGRRHCRSTPDLMPGFYLA